jgi:hypothetical protein
VIAGLEATAESDGGGIARARDDAVAFEPGADEVAVANADADFNVLKSFGAEVVESAFVMIVPLVVGDTADPCIHQNTLTATPITSSRTRIVRDFIRDYYDNYLLGIRSQDEINTKQ